MPVSAAVEERPALDLIKTQDEITLTHAQDEPFFLFDLGVGVVAGDRTVEVVARRARYSSPISATLVLRRGSSVTRRRLPPGLVTNLSGLTGFFTLEVRRPDGSLAASRTETLCLSSPDASRARLDAAPDNPYPRTCGGHPFALGGLWGLPAGWAVNASPAGLGLFPQNDPDPLVLADGDYDASIRVTDTYRELLGIPLSKSQVSVRVHVVRAPNTLAASSTGPRRTITARPLQGARSPARNDGRGLPNLRPLPALGILVTDGDGTTQPDHQFLQFDATVADLSGAPLVVDGFRRPNTSTMDAYQYLFDDRGREVGRKRVGTFRFDGDPAEQEWHFLDFARYRLVDDQHRRSVLSTKQGFCLAATDPVDLTLPQADLDPVSTGLEGACGRQTAIGLRQQLAAGWGDTYTQSTPGQAFDITTVPNGEYVIEIEANPLRGIAETDYADNLARRRIVLGGRRGARTVTVPPHEGLDVP